MEIEETFYWKSLQSIKDCMAKAGEPLTDHQYMLLAGQLAIWLNLAGVKE